MLRSEKFEKAKDGRKLSREKRTDEFNRGISFIGEENVI